MMWMQFKSKEGTAIQEPICLACVAKSGTEGYIPIVPDKYYRYKCRVCGKIFEVKGVEK